MRTKHGDIYRYQIFKHLGDFLTSNVTAKLSIKERARKTEMAFKLRQKTFKSQYLSYQDKFRHILK